MRFLAARRTEGEALGNVIGSQLREIKGLVERASGMAAATPSALRDKIKAQIDDLLGGGEFNEERLEQEAALLAVKADIREELDRLRAHIDAAELLLQDEGPVGRQLDFLAQEFNREANTLCSKVQDIELKRIGLELKTVIDQMREQVQNVE